MIPATPRQLENMGRLMLCLALCACKPVDRGTCLASHVKNRWLQMAPIISGKTVIFVPISHPATRVCDRWEFPEGRRRVD